MIESLEIILFAVLVVSGVLVARMRNLFGAAMLTGMFSLVSAGLFTLMDAVDVAFTEAAVGAGFSTVLILATLSITDVEEKERTPSMLPFIVVSLVGLALVVGTLDMAPYGSPEAQIHQRVTKEYIKREHTKAQFASNELNGLETTKEAQELKAVGLPNLVTSILASYRGYDTLGETAVIFTAGVGVMLLLQRVRRKEDEGDEEASS